MCMTTYAMPCLILATRSLMVMPWSGPVRFWAVILPLASTPLNLPGMSWGGGSLGYSHTIMGPRAWPLSMCMCAMVMFCMRVTMIMKYSVAWFLSRWKMAMPRAWVLIVYVTLVLTRDVHVLPVMNAVKLYLSCLS